MLIHLAWPRTAKTQLAAADASIHLANYCVMHSIPMIFLSTTAAYATLSLYGSAKRKVEDHLFALGSKSLSVVRAGLVWGSALSPALQALARVPRFLSLTPCAPHFAALPHTPLKYLTALLIEEADRCRHATSRGSTSPLAAYCSDAIPFGELYKVVNPNDQRPKFPLPISAVRLALRYREYLPNQIHTALDRAAALLTNAGTDTDCSVTVNWPLGKDAFIAWVSRALDRIES